MNPTDTLSAPASLPWSRHLTLLLALSLCVLLAACGTRSPSGSGSGPGGYPVGAGDYRNDGPHANPPDLSRIPDAVPRIETLATGANRPYVINGTRYVPDVTGSPYRARGRASWYGRQFHGRPTSNGEIYDMYAMTAAHPTLPIPSYARVSRADGSRQVIVRINDRGPFHSSRIIDLSYAAAHRLDTLRHGTAEVVVERIMPEEIRRGSFGSAPVVATPSTPPATTWSPPPTAAVPAPVSGSAYLQLGAFSDPARAQALVTQLSGTLGDIGPVNLHHPSDRVYRVRLGPLEAGRARQLVETVYQRSGIMPHVTAP